MSATSTPRSARFDLPPAPIHSASSTSHSTTDSALAEWANKIRAMQRQVDTDEETEQRRLEEEIVRARLARQRRVRTGQSGDFGVGMHGIDLAKLQEGSRAVENRSIESHVQSASNAETAPPLVTFPKSASKPTEVSGTKHSPISLAEFMGGSASGPRLKRHEPQADGSLVHDGRIQHGSVHPIFGRGGVALPGMTSKVVRTNSTADEMHTSSQALSNTPSMATPRLSPSDLTRSRTTSTLAAARRYVEKLEEHAPSQPQTPRLTGSAIRERRISTPAGSSYAELKVTTPIMSTRPLSQHFSGKAATPVTETLPKTPVAAEARRQTPATIDARMETPTSDTQRKLLAIIEPCSKAPISDFCATTPSDRSCTKTPIQSTQSRFPDPAPSFTPSSVSVPIPPRPPASAVRTSHSPQQQSSSGPVFLRPRMNSSKEPTPSISRLQGRGFVQSIVQATQTGTQGSPSVKNMFPPSPQAQAQAQNETRNKSTRRASVLDRWQPVLNNSGGSSSTPPRVSSPTRSYTVNLKQGEDILDVKTHDTGKTVRNSVSMPAIPKTPLKKSDVLPGQGVDGKLGSASTMVTFINLAKAGNNSLVPAVDELGVKAGDAVGSRVGVIDHTVKSGAAVQTKAPMMPPSSPSPSAGKPLSHPTKDRAKKPRKASRLGDTSGLNHAGRSVISEGWAPLGLPSTRSTLVSSIPRSSTMSTHSDSQSPRGPAVFPAGAGFGLAMQSKVSIPSSPGLTINNSSYLTQLSPSAKHGMTDMTSRALPGLTGLSAVMTPSSAQDSVPKEREERTVLPSPIKCARIPSTGNRALVMDVAQALGEIRLEDPFPAHPLSTCLNSGDLGRGLRLAPSMERRKSSYERHATMALPTLREEQTPLPTPMHTLPRSGNIVVSKDNLEVDTIPADPNVASSELDIVHIDVPLPVVDVEALLTAPRPSAFVPNPNLTTISVEVIDILHGSAISIRHDNHILYDTELLVIIHRAKSRESGLATTKVWCWRGKKSWCTEREEKKSAELARRYGTLAEVIHQQCEPPVLVHVLGGKIAIRQGSRSHWSSENTTMHVVKSRDTQILIDELDLSIKNLCSGYSYCITTLDHIYVWHGTGSTPAERSAALGYAGLMTTASRPIIELMEGRGDANDEMFWMIVGDPDSYAKADYWRWRNMSVPSEPRCWLVDLSHKDTPVCPVPVLSTVTILQESVYIIDCFWEFFVLVGKHARGKRADIALAVNTVMTMSKLTAKSKPFSPTVHVLIAPTQLPLDMRLAFRNLDESALNDGHVPDHMNILSTQEAMEHLQTSSWEKSALRDHMMLPLGLDLTHVPPL
ncbi:hypothetical protein J3A83DRAFT_2696450 [Scleroderma citrinum]